NGPVDGESFSERGHPVDRCQVASPVACRPGQRPSELDEVTVSCGPGPRVHPPERVERPPDRRTVGPAVHHGEQTVGDPGASRDDGDDGVFRALERFQPVSNGGEVGERRAAELDDHGAVAMRHARGRYPLARASSALRTEPPAPPRTALWLRTKKRRYGGSQ